MKRPRMLLQGLALVLALAAGPQLSAQDSRFPISPDAAGVITRQQLPDVLQWIDPEDLLQYGFSRSDDFGAIRIGKPVYSLHFSDLHHDNNHELQTGTILMPLWLEGRVRCFVYLSAENGRWQVTGIGGHNEATRWMPFLERTEEDKTRNSSVVVHVFNGDGDYLLDERNATYADISVWKRPENLRKEPLTLTALHQLAYDAAAEARAHGGELTN